MIPIRHNCWNAVNFAPRGHELGPSDYKAGTETAVPYWCCAGESSCVEGDVLGAAERKALCPLAAGMKVAYAELDGASGGALSAPLSLW